MSVTRFVQFGRSSSYPISLCSGLVLGCFVVAASNNDAIIVSKVTGSFPCFFFCLLVAGYRLDGGEADWGLEAWRACMRCRAPKLPWRLSCVLAFAAVMIVMHIAAFSNA
jgi:hypothetical protein